ncbi:MAG: hypothetical protein WCB00_24330 [Candidatus Acidiferrales bacterium]
MTDFKPEIRKILDKHRDRFVLKPLSFPNERMEQARLERERDFDLMTHFLTRSMDEDDVEEFKQNIADKLAYDSLPRIGDNWWWTPPSDLVASTLRDVKRTLERSTEKKARNWFRKVRWMWWVLRELIYLGIVLSLFSVASSRFETVTVAALVLIYSQVAFVGSAIGMSVVYLAHTAEVIYWEFGRTLRLKVPISRLTEARKLVDDLSIPNLIHNISIGIGSLIALWHLVIALLR